MIAYHSVRIDHFEDSLEIANLLLKDMLVLTLGNAVAEIQNVFRQPPFVDV